MSGVDHRPLTAKALLAEWAAECASFRHDYPPDDVVRVGLPITPDKGPTEAVTVSVESHGAAGPFVVFTGRWADLVDYFAKLTA